MKVLGLQVGALGLAGDEQADLVVHGGATWGSSVNRDQLRDCTSFMAKLVPLVIEVMMHDPDRDRCGLIFRILDQFKHLEPAFRTVIPSFNGRFLQKQNLEIR